MATITDDEFGDITLRRSARASNVRIRVGPDGRLRASLPLYAPTFLVKRLLKNSRAELRTLLQDQHGTSEYENGMTIGKSHSLLVRPSASTQATAKRHGQHIIVSLPTTLQLDDAAVKRTIRDTVIEALRVEAKAYLPRRIAYLAAEHDYSYDKLRFSHASGRWGSCSNNGTISLNIALMKLPFELIDYVLIHELSHTQEMNHSPAFWDLVEAADPHYKLHRKRLKHESPTI